MNKVTCYIIFLLFPLISISQEKFALKLDEITLSVNSTYKQLYYDQGLFGFGAGIFFAFNNEHMLNARLGLEYNRTEKFFKYVDNGHYSHYEDVTYRHNDLSFPLELRLTIGQKTKFFIESGVYMDFPLYSKMEGTIYYYHVIYDTMPYQVDSGHYLVNNKISGNFSIGAIFGAGVIIPGSKIDLIFKSDYKLGLNNIYDDAGYSQAASRYIRLSAGIRFNHTVKKPKQ